MKARQDPVSKCIQFSETKKHFAPAKYRLNWQTRFFEGQIGVGDEKKEQGEEKVNFWQSWGAIEIGTLS